MYSPPCHPRRPCLSFFSRKKKIKVFDENIPGFSPYSIMDFTGHQMVQGPNESFSAASKGFKQY